MDSSVAISSPSQAPRPVEPPFTRKALGKMWGWSRELELLHGFASRWNFALHYSDATYQIAKLSGPGFRVVIYPHKTTGTGNISARVRNEGSARPEVADAVMRCLKALQPDYNTFSRLNHPQFGADDLSHEEGRLEILLGQAAQPNQTKRERGE